jgi:hypothetical protein
MLGYAVLVIVFANGVYIHDYYSIQLLIPFSLAFAGSLSKMSKPFAIAALFLLLVLGVNQTKSATSPLGHIEFIAAKIQKISTKDETIAVSSDRAIAPIAIMAQRKIYSVSEKYFDNFYSQKSVMGGVPWVVLVYFDLELLNKLKNQLKSTYLLLEEGPINPIYGIKDPPMNFALLKKIKERP